MDTSAKHPSSFKVADGENEPIIPKSKNDLSKMANVHKNNLPVMEQEETGYNDNWKNK